MSVSNNHGWVVWCACGTCVRPVTDGKGGWVPCRRGAAVAPLLLFLLLLLRLPLVLITMHVVEVDRAMHDGSGQDHYPSPTLVTACYC